MATGLMGVTASLGASIVFPAVASAALTPTPISYGGSPSTIGLVPTGAGPGGSPTDVVAGQKDQPATSWAFSLSDSGTVSAGSAPTWVTGDTFAIPLVQPGGAVNNLTAGSYVEFAGVPTMNCTGGGAGVTQPTFNLTTTENPNDTIADAGLTDVLVITFTNSPIVQSPTPFECVISNINYTIGPNTGTGSIGSFGSATNQATYTQGLAPGSVSPVGGSGGTDQEALNVVGNANIIEQTVTANTPPVSVLPNAIDAPISPISITEAKLGAVSGNYICVTASQTLGTNGFVVTSAAPTITVSASSTGGTATISPVVIGLTPNANGSFQTIAADVLISSTTVPTTYTFSQLAVDAPSTPGDVTVTITVGASIVGGACTGGTPLAIEGNPNFAPPTIYAVGQPTFNSRIEGSTADQTAVAALEDEYPPHVGFCIPAGIFAVPARPETGSSVVLATDATWQDALTASYLAAWLHTGVLLTPTDSLSPYALTAIEQEGVSNVVIVGGTLAVSQAIQNQLASTPSYNCGGATPMLNALGQSIDLNVQRIAGATADGTAEAVATYVDSGYVGSLNISGSFGQYNDTLGTDSGSSPTISVRTAILVTDNSFQDAASASAMSYAEHLPILLTPQASLGTEAETALLDLGIQQVIELGGPLAISNSVNASLMSQGVSVLRIAGTDGTDTSVQLAKFELNRYGTFDGLGWGTCTAAASRTYVLNVGDASSGSFDLVWNAFSTLPMAYNASNAAILVALQLLAGFPAGATVTGGPLPIAQVTITIPSTASLAITSALGGTTSTPSVTNVTGPVCTTPVALARGDFFSDAITSSVVTGRNNEPIILAENPTTLGTYATGFFNQAGSPYGVDPFSQTALSPVPGSGSSVNSITVFGGPLAIANSTLQAALEAISQG